MSVLILEDFMDPSSESLSQALTHERKKMFGEETSRRNNGSKAMEWRNLRQAGNRSDRFEVERGGGEMSGL